MPIISIIVPVYKVEKYLKKCIESILDQTFENFELILIDDGSPDSCGKICDEYAEKDTRITVIHQTNSGISHARNEGIKVAKGQYIGFVDSDDYINERMYEILYTNIVKHDADMSVCRMKKVYDNDKLECLEDNENHMEYILNEKDCMSIIFSKSDIISAFAWNKLYKRDIFDELRYPEGQTYEDIYIITDVLSKCNRVYVTDEKLYYYLQRNDSITGSKYSDSDKNSVVAAKKVYAFFEQYWPQYLDTANSFLCKVNFSVLGKMAYCCDKKDITARKEIVSFLNDKIGFVLKSGEFSLGRKISAIALRINYRLFFFCVRLSKKV